MVKICLLQTSIKTILTNLVTMPKEEQTLVNRIQSDNSLALKISFLNDHSLKCFLPTQLKIMLKKLNKVSMLNH